MGDAGLPPDDGGPSPSDGGPISGDAGPPAMDAGPLVVEYPAATAACLFLDVPDSGPALCDDASPGELQIDTVTTDPGVDTVARGYAIFSLDALANGRTLLAAELRLRVAADGGADSNSTGEVWTTEPFTAAGLTSSVPPARLVKIGDDQGAVALGQDVVIPLNLGAAPLAAARIYVAIVAVTSDGLAYLGEGDLRPRLVLTLER